MAELDTSENDELASILAETEQSSNTEIPMERPLVADEAPQAPQEYEIEYNGQKIKAPIEKVLKWASMGYGAPNKIGELSQKLADYQTKSQQYEQYSKTYAPIDEWARQNPDKWQSLFQNWQQAQYGVMPQNQNPAPQPQQGMASQLPPELLSEIQQSRQFRESVLESQKAQKLQQADQTLDLEILSIRKSYPNLDFDAPDAKGNSLEFQILEHATKMGIPSFRAAFRDYCFDQLGSLSKSEALTKGQGIPMKTKAGLLGKDPAPNRSSRTVADLIKNRNYDQIHALVLEDLGLGAG